MAQETPAERTARLLAACEINFPGYHEAQRALSPLPSILICPYCNQEIP